MSTMTADIATLCAAIDAGDDSALLPLADALEEAGDARSAGLRRLADPENPTPVWLKERPRPIGWGGGFVWHRGVDVNFAAQMAGCLPSRVYERIGGEPVSLTHRFPRGGVTQVQGRRFATRSAAFLALAETMAQE